MSLRARVHAWDERASAWLQAPVARSRGWRWAAWLLAHSGDSWVTVPALLLAAGLWPAARPRLLVAVAAVLVLAGLVLALKFAIRRERPRSPWGGIYRKTDPHAFPSGHAARALLLAGLAWAWLPPGAAAGVTLWALGVSWARLALGLHYPTDVLAGGLLGLAVAALARGWG